MTGRDIDSKGHRPSRMCSAHPPVGRAAVPAARDLGGRRSRHGALTVHRESDLLDSATLDVRAGLQQAHLFVPPVETADDRGARGRAGRRLRRRVPVEVELSGTGACSSFITPTSTSATPIRRLTCSGTRSRTSTRARLCGGGRCLPLDDREQRRARALACEPAARLQNELLDLLRNGRFEACALPFTMHAHAASIDELARQLRFAHELRETHGVEVVTAMQTDVPGAPPGLPLVLADAGVRYLSVAHNWAGRATPYLTGGETLPRAFFWKTRSGERVLVWHTDSPHGASYLEGNLLGLAESVDLTEQLLPDYLAALASRGYPFTGVLGVPAERAPYPLDVLHLRVQGTFADNAAPSPVPARVARAWNERYAFPELARRPSRVLRDAPAGRPGDVHRRLGRLVDRRARIVRPHDRLQPPRTGRSADRPDPGRSVRLDRRRGAPRTSGSRSSTSTPGARRTRGVRRSPGASRARSSGDEGGAGDLRSRVLRGTRRRSGGLVTYRGESVVGAGAEPQRLPAPACRFCCPSRARSRSSTPRRRSAYRMPSDRPSRTATGRAAGRSPSSRRTFHRSATDASISSPTTRRRRRAEVRSRTRPIDWRSISRAAARRASSTSSSESSSSLPRARSAWPGRARPLRRRARRDRAASAGQRADHGIDGRLRRGVRHVPRGRDRRDRRRTCLESGRGADDAADSSATGFEASRRPSGSCAACGGSTSPRRLLKTGDAEKESVHVVFPFGAARSRPSPTS